MDLPATTQSARCRRLLHEHRVGAAVDDPSVHALRRDDPARARCGVEDLNGDAALAQLVCRRQPRNAATDDRDVHRRHHA